MSSVTTHETVTIGEGKNVKTILRRIKQAERKLNHG